jgi:hypothetical protein
MDPNLLQWPAMLMTVCASWLVTARVRSRRLFGFRVFLISNVMWGIWGMHDNAYALVVLQICLAALNLRGVLINED